MKDLKFIFIALFVLLTGCADDSEKKVIPKKEFIPILVDMHLMDGMLADKDMREKVIQSDTAEYYKALFRQHGYTKPQFDSTVAYYSQDLKEFDRIYQEVLARLNKMETEAKEKLQQEREKEAEERERADSLNISNKQTLKKKK